MDSAETLAVNIQVFGEEKYEPYTESPNSPRPKNARQVKSKSRTCWSFSWTPGGLFTKNSSWQAKQSIPHNTVTFYGDCVKMCEDFTPNFGDKKLAVALQQRTVSHLLFHKGIFYQKQHDCYLPFTLPFSVFSTEDKTERPEF
jgi:hypothetical protein